MIKSDGNKHCLKCGRNGHEHDSCYAKKDIYGKSIVNYCDEHERKKRRRLNDTPSEEDISEEANHISNRQVFSTVLTAITSNIEKTKSGVYVLRLENGKYYVGSSEYIESRIQAHFVGHGSSWTKLYKPIERLVPLTSPMSHLESWERLEFINRVLCHGIDNVRGWAYTSSYLTLEELYKLLQDIAEAKNLCRRCFRDSHFISSCKEGTYADWVGGNEI
jgi:hypothetical protein